MLPEAQSHQLHLQKHVRLLPEHILFQNNKTLNFQFLFQTHIIPISQTERIRTRIIFQCKKCNFFTTFKNHPVLYIPLSNPLQYILFRDHHFPFLSEGFSSLSFFPQIILQVCLQKPVP